jgi:hypothetical protein
MGLPEIAIQSWKNTNPHQEGNGYGHRGDQVSQYGGGIPVQSGWSINLLRCSLFDKIITYVLEEPRA